MIRMLAEMTWEEARDLDPARAVAVLPVGALEAHGPHLPLSTDVVIASAMARAGAEALARRGLQPVVLPPLAFTPAPYAAAFAGTISIPPAAVSAWVVDLARELTRHRFAALAIANAHLDPAHLGALAEAAAGARAERLLPIAAPDLTRKPWGARLGEEFRSGACHAGRYESSIVMAERPELVRESVRRALPPNPASLSLAIQQNLRTFVAAGGPRAYFGWPADASAEEGRATVATLGEILAEATAEALAASTAPAPSEARPLAGRGAVVTGAGRGIGAAIARALALAGARVVLAARGLAEIEAVAAEITAAGGRAWAIACDVTDEASVRRLAAAAGERLGAVDLLVNNAGASSSAPLSKIALAEWDRMWSVNATGTFLCTREFAPAMVERGFGRIVNVASIAGLEGARYVAHYTAAKHAVVGFTRAVALELAFTGVTVNAVCPGYVDTPMTERTLENIVTRTAMPAEHGLKMLLATTGQGRLIAPHEVAAAVLDLCLESAANLNGRAIVLSPLGKVS